MRSESNVTLSVDVTAFHYFRVRSIEVNFGALTITAKVYMSMNIADGSHDSYGAVNPCGTDTTEGLQLGTRTCFWSCGTWQHEQIAQPKGMYGRAVTRLGICYLTSNM